MLMLNVSHAQVLSWTMIKMFFCSFILNLAFLREKRKLKKKKKKGLWLISPNNKIGKADVEY